MSRWAMMSEMVEDLALRPLVEQLLVAEVGHVEGVRMATTPAAPGRG